MATLRQDLGPVTAYAFAVEKGYTGTEEEYAELMASYATVAEAAAGSASDAEAYGAGTRGGSAVESDDEAYHNNAKYYAESAADDAGTVASAVSTFTETTVPGAVQSVTDEGTRQVGLVQGEGTTQIGLVSGEGTTQVGAVEAKGAEVLESIPEDYTELSDDVSDLKSALTYSNGRMRFLYSPLYGKNIIDSSAVASGKYINWTNGNEAPSASYVASDYIPVIKGILYGYTGSNTHFAFYDESKNYIKETTANDITELSGGSVTVTTGSTPGQYFVSPIDGYIRYTMSADWLPAARRIFMAITSAADLIGTKYPAYTDSVYAEPVDRARLSEDESDISALESEVDKINENLNNVFLVSPNLLDTAAMTDGYLMNNGEVYTASTTYITSDFIPCNVGDTIRYQFNYKGTRYDNTTVPNYTAMYFIDAYNSDKEYINSSYATIQSSYVCPANSAFVRITFLKATFNAGDYSNAAIIISDSSNVVPYSAFGALLGLEGRIDAYLPPDIYCAVGRTIELYNNQVCLQADEYHVQWNCTIGKALKRKYSITGANDLIGTYTLSVTVYNDDSAVLWSATSTLHIVAELDLQNAYSICPIGDSLTNAKQWMPEVMNLSDNSISFVGTYTATAQDSSGAYKSFNHEGRSGFSAANYINGSPYTFGGATETPHNKFWDGNAFSWSYYKTTYSINPDAVMIWLGINGISLDNTANAGYIKGMVEAIRDNDASIPIFVCNTIYRGDQNGIGAQTSNDGYAANKGQWNYQEKLKIMNLMQTLDGLFSDYEDVHLVNLALSHDSEYNFGAVSTPVNPRASQTELMPIEATHPQAQGYFQIADIIYSVLSAVLT